MTDTDGDTSNQPPTAWEDPLVLHVIPTARARGAQREARALADHLDRPGRRLHRVLSLFGGPGDVPVDLALDHRGGDTPGLGLDLALVVRLRSFLIGVDPAVVIAHGSEPLKYLVPAMAGRRRALVYYAIGTYSGSPRRTQERLWRYLHRRPDLIIAEGEEVRSECITRFRVPQGRVVFVPNGRDPEAFHPRTHGPLTDVPRLLFVGALTAGKRPDRFIAAVKSLRDRGVPFQAGLVGDGPLRSGLIAPAQAADVEMLGSRSDVADLLRQADMLVFPSLPAGEGMPGVLIEAGLSGLPVVATDVPGVRSIVDDGVTGLVVGVEDPEAMTDALAGLLADAARRTSMGAAARSYCLSRFTIASVAERWAEALSPLLDGAPAPSGERRHTGST